MSPRLQRILLWFVLVFGAIDMVGSVVLTVMLGAAFNTVIGIVVGAALIGFSVFRLRELRGS